MLAVAARIQSDSRLLRVCTFRSLHQLMFSLPSGWHASHGDRGLTCPSALSVVPPLSRSTLHPPVGGRQSCSARCTICTQCWARHEPFITAPPPVAGGRLQCPMSLSGLSTSTQPTLIHRQILHLHRDCHMTFRTTHLTLGIPHFYSWNASRLQ